MNPSNGSVDTEATAALWFARRESGAWTPADQAELDAWLDRATVHRIEFLRLATAWEHAGRLQALGAGIPPGVIPAREAWGLQPGEPASEAPVRSTRPVWFTRRIAAVAAGLVVMTVAAGLRLAMMSPALVYSTPVGVLATVPLTDGSTITLNTSSQIHLSFSSKTREVTLDRGEAFFEVAKDPARPFVVLIGSQRVTAVGTQFAVRRDEDGMRVLVTEGLVQLVHQSLLSRSLATPVSAGSEARAQDDTIYVDQPKSAQVDESLSWRSGYLVFHDTPLAEAVAEFNRYNTRPIVIADPTIATLRIGGRFRFRDSDAFLSLLTSGFPISVAEDSTVVRLAHR